MIAERANCIARRAGVMGDAGGRPPAGVALDASGHDAPMPSPPSTGMTAPVM